MTAIVFFILISISCSHQLTGPGDVHGEVGGSVTAECKYHQSCKENVKYWCKGYHYIRCSIIVSTDNPQSGRVSMTDDKKHNILSITMDNLMKSDEGRYWCVIERFFPNERVSFKLEVFEVPTWSSTMGPTSSIAGTTQSHVTMDLTTSSATISSTSEENLPLDLMASWQVILVVVVLIIIVLLAAAVILYVKLKQQKKSVTVERNAAGFGSLASSVTEDTTVMYSTVKVVPKADLESTYINLQDLQCQGTAKDQSSSDSVEYSTIVFRSQRNNPKEEPRVLSPGNVNNMSMIQHRPLKRHRDTCITQKTVDNFTGTMKFTALLVLSLISTSWTEITWTVLKAAAGKNITVKFPWKWNQRDVAIWCKTYSETRCNVIASFKKGMNKSFQSKTSISEAHGSIFITMQPLWKNDTGTYWWGAADQQSIIVSDGTLLKVFTDSEESIPTEINNVMENTTTVSCLYTQQEEIDYKKFFCKVTSVNKCTVIADSNKNIGNEYKGRVSIMTNKSQNFTITMSNTSKADEGQYWCGSVKIDDVKITQVKNLTIASEGIPAVSIDTPSNITPQKWYIILAVLLGLLILSLLILFTWKRKVTKRAGNEAKNENPEIPDMTRKSDREMEDTVIHSTMTLQSSAQTKEDSVTYANLKDLKQQKENININASESVEYAALQFKS
ncbi:uncharacterized protein LOC125462660 [Stegostoma tigrinum]|uniref:uncharacterized protein LOC125462660 n=1 Tax=Stegostoma tigrinum TaxID=3053191 RepID=UPI002870470B|nr:uncharacterized protein LOC125462660 [Stegostoma tigrinum]